MTRPVPYIQLCRDAWLAGLSQDELLERLSGQIGLLSLIEGAAEYSRLVKAERASSDELFRQGHLHGEGPASPRQDPTVQGRKQ